MPTAGATNMPETETKHEPIAHAYRRTFAGLVACSANRSGSSTTACIEMPSRVYRKNRYRPMVPASASSVMMI